MNWVAENALVESPSIHFLCPGMPLAQHLIISRATAGGRFQSITATRSGEASIPIPACGAVLNHRTGTHH